MLRPERRWLTPSAKPKKTPNGWTREGDGVRRGKAGQQTGVTTLECEKKFEFYPKGRRKPTKVFQQSWKTRLAFFGNGQLSVPR